MKYLILLLIALSYNISYAQLDLLSLSKKEVLIGMNRYDEMLFASDSADLVRYLWNDQVMTFVFENDTARYLVRSVDLNLAESMKKHFEEDIYTRIDTDEIVYSFYNEGVKYSVGYCIQKDRLDLVYCTWSVYANE